MITIGICDDNSRQVELLEKYINPGADEYDIIKSTDPEEFLNLAQSRKPQLVFLDIDMGRISGLELGEQIKARYEDTVIIYITAYEKYAVAAFGIRAFHYLLKPLTRETFNDVFREALRHIENARTKTEKTMTVKTKKEVVSLKLSDIIYFEKTGHSIKIHTLQRDLSYYDNLKNLLDTLGGEFFIQCHQGYIANISRITGFRDKTLFLDDHSELPVSRTYTDAVKKILAERLFAGKDEQ